MATGVFLEENPPARRQYFNPRRSKVTGAIVVHTAENTTDRVLPDGGAEGVARFIAGRTDAAGSYHTVVDSDSIVEVGQYWWEMFGEGTGGNRWALHLSFACQASQWPTLSARWVAGALDHGGVAAADMARWVHKTERITVPRHHLTRAEYRAGKPGFIGHGELDPGRRSDPGDGFPWDAFFDRYDIALEQGHTNMPEYINLPANRDPEIREQQQVLKDAGFYAGLIDGDPYKQMTGAVHAIKNENARLGAALAEAQDSLRRKIDVVSRLQAQLDDLMGGDPTTRAEDAAIGRDFMALVAKMAAVHANRDQ